MADAKGEGIRKTPLNPTTTESSSQTQRQLWPDFEVTIGFSTPNVRRRRNPGPGQRCPVTQASTRPGRLPWALPKIWAPSCQGVWACGAWQGLLPGMPYAEPGKLLGEGRFFSRTRSAMLEKHLDFDQVRSDSAPDPSPNPLAEPLGVGDGADFPSQNRVSGGAKPRKRGEFHG